MRLVGMIVVFILGITAGGCRPSEPFVVAERGQFSHCAIFVAEHAEDGVLEALAAFRDYVRSKTGIELPVCNDCGTIPRNAVLFGPTRYPIADTMLKGTGFRLTVKFDRLYLRGKASGAAGWMEAIKANDVGGPSSVAFPRDLDIVIPSAMCAGDAASGVRVDTSPDRVESPLQVSMKRIGTLRARRRPIPGDRRWSISSTCLDRNFADFDAYKHLLAPLGIYDVRLQAGWAKCESQKGRFDFAWLDEQVDYCLANGMNPMLETSYGNPIYEGGGGWDLSGGIPFGEIGLAAWDRWIDALVRHFKGRVNAWMMWNEPSNNSKNTPDVIASFNARTARIIKRHIPDASIGAFAFGGARQQEFVDCFEHLGADARLFDRYIYHGYEKNPDTSYQYVTNIQAIIRRYAPHAIAWQGENGCPSEMSSTFALNKTVWSEYSQAKWDLRRMLGDLGHDVPSSVFTFCDFYHDAAKSTAHRVEMNRKGLVRANEAHEVVAIKRAYYSVQNCVTVFDPSVKRIAEPAMSVTDTNIALYEYEKTDIPIWVFWDKTDVPGDSFQTRPLTFYSTRAPLVNPVWVDLLTGRVYEFPKKKQLVHSQGVMYVDVPVYDSPCLLTERSVFDVDLEFVNQIKKGLP